MILLRLPNLIFVFVLALVVLHGTVCVAAPLSPQVEVVFDEDGEDDEDEFEDEADFKNNPWQIDERKLFAAKKFQLTKQFAIKIAQMDSVCGLDKKQKLKLKIASKGATEQSLDKFVKQWDEQMKQFGGNFGRGNQAGDDEGDKKKKKVKKKKKRFVVNKVEEIDAQVFQMLEGNMFGNTVNSDVTDVSIWNSTVKKVLDNEQQRKLEVRIEKLKLAKRNVRADAFVANMRLELALSDDQLVGFDELVRPAFLKKDVNVNWQYDSMATLYFGSKYDKKKMKKLLSEDQDLILRLRIKPAESYGHMLGDNNNGNGNVVAAEPEQYVVKVFEAAFDGLAELADDFGDAIGGAFEWAR